MKAVAQKLLASIYMGLFSCQLSAQQSLDWGEWDAPISTVDQLSALNLDALPLSVEQKNQLQQRIHKLQARYGVGILGTLETAISQLDKSSLNNESDPAAEQPSAIDSKQPFLRDLQLERQIRSLEFAKRTQPDPEGLSTKSTGDQQLFSQLMNKLTAIEKQQSANRQ